MNESPLHVLVVEDQAPVAAALEVLFSLHGLPCRFASGAAEALRAVRAGGVGVVVQDMNFGPGEVSGEEGAALFREVRALDPEIPVVLMTAFTSLERAVALVKEGAADYVGKPWDDAKLVATVRTLLRAREAEAENARLRAGRAASREDLRSRFDLRGLIYESEALHRVVSLAVQVAPSDAPVLVTGPNGAGKELIAEIVQANSRRKGKPFVKVNAGALPDELLEAELFGAEAGAYTGAAKRRLGRFEAADGGTLFLDEIANLSGRGQAKLLRVLQTGEFERLGSSETRRVDVRVFAATNADLPAAIAKGAFREDLWFRLNVVELRVPPLADRPEDVGLLASAFLEEAARAAGKAPAPSLSPEARQALRRHDWPGNVRELRNRLQRAVLVGGDTLSAADLDFEAAADPPPRPRVPDHERGALEDLLVRHGGSVSRAAEDLGLSRQALYRRMERLGVVLERKPRD